MEFSNFKLQGVGTPSKGQGAQGQKTVTPKAVEPLWGNSIAQLRSTGTATAEEALLDIGGTSAANKVDTAAKKIAEKRAKKFKQRAKKNGENIDIKVDGDKVIQTIKDKDGKITNVVTKQYNAKGKVIAKSNQVCDENGLPARIANIKYDESGKKLSKTVTGKVDGVDTTVEVEYTNGALPSKKTITKGSGANKEVTDVEYTYDKNNLLQKKVKTLPNGDVRTTNYVDYKSGEADGIIQRTAKVTIVDKNGKELEKFDEMQKLNRNNQITSTERTDDKGNVLRRSESIYDEKFNLTERKVVRFYTGEDGKSMGSSSIYSNFKQTAVGKKFDIKTEVYENNMETGLKLVDTTHKKGMMYFDGSQDNDYLENKDSDKKLV